MWCSFLVFNLIASVHLLLILFLPTSSKAFPSLPPSLLLPPSLSFWPSGFHLGGSVSRATGSSSGWHHLGQHFFLSQSLLMIREKWGPESPFSPGTVICFIDLGQDHCRMLTDSLLHSYNADTLKCYGNKRATGMLCSEESAPPHCMPSWHGHLFLHLSLGTYRFGHLIIWLWSSFGDSLTNYHTT